MVFGGPEDPVGDIAAGGYLAYEWLIIDTAVVAAGASGGTVQASMPPVPWADPTQPPGADWNGEDRMRREVRRAPGTIRGLGKVCIRI